jgi:hypothetical protein
MWIDVPSGKNYSRFLAECSAETQHDDGGFREKIDITIASMTITEPMQNVPERTHLSVPILLPGRRLALELPDRILIVTLR